MTTNTKNIIKFSNGMTLEVSHSNTIFDNIHILYLDIYNNSRRCIFNAKFNIKSIPIIYYIIKDSIYWNNMYCSPELFYSKDGFIIYAAGSIPKFENNIDFEKLDAFLKDMLLLYKNSIASTETLKTLLHYLNIKKDKDEYILKFGKSLFNYLEKQGCVIQFSTL